MEDGGGLIHVEPSSCGAMTAYVAARGRSYIHSAISPRDEARLWSERLHKRGKTYFIFGLGLAYHIIELLKCLDEDAKLFIYEPNAKWVDLARKYNNTSDKRVYIATDWNSYKNLMDRWFIQKHGYTKTFWLASKEIYRTEYDTWLRKVDLELNAFQADTITSIRFSWEWNKNAIRNLRFLKESYPVSRMFGRWENKPFVILSAGPTLARDLDVVRKMKGHALIVAVGSVLPLLHKKGIKPDFYMAFDGGINNYWGHFEGITTDVPIIYDLILHHKILENYTGPKVIMSIWPGDVLLDRWVKQTTGHVMIGPSVANSIMDLGVKVGADPIIFIGQDLAYIDNKTHSAGVLNLACDYSPIPTMEHLMCNGIRGNRLVTNRSMATFMHCFAERIGADKSRQYVNCSMEGAQINGTVNLSAEEAVERYCQKDLSGELKAIKQEIFKPPSWSATGLRECLKRNIASMEALRMELKPEMEFDQELVNINRALLYFGVQAVWEASKTGGQKEWMMRETREAIGYVLPFLEETVGVV